MVHDQQQIGVEQMKLFREAGVNPLGGCIPALVADSYILCIV